MSGENEPTYDRQQVLRRRGSTSDIVRGLTDVFATVGELCCVFSKRLRSVYHRPVQYPGVTGRRGGHSRAG